MNKVDMSLLVVTKVGQANTPWWAGFEPLLGRWSGLTFIPQRLLHDTPLWVRPTQGGRTARERRSA
jgi:hypothetical protein